MRLFEYSIVQLKEAARDLKRSKKPRDKAMLEAVQEWLKRRLLEARGEPTR